MSQALNLVRQALERFTELQAQTVLARAGKGDWAAVAAVAVSLLRTLESALAALEADEDDDAP